MKKHLFSLEEIMPSNIYKNNKEFTIIKYKEKENKRVKSVVKNNIDKKSKPKVLKQTNKNNDYSKTPVKFIGKTKLNKFMNSYNECNKDSSNNNNNILSLSTNGKQMLLLEYFLQSNNKSVKPNTFLFGPNKEEYKNLNKVTKSLFPLKKPINNQKLQNTRYFNSNYKNLKNVNHQKEKNDIKKSINKPIIKKEKEKVKELIKKNDEEIKNNNILINKTNTISNNNYNNSIVHNLKSNSKEEKNQNLLKTSVNISNNKNEKEKINNENTKKVKDIIKTPNNIFKNKIINIINNNNNNSIEVNLLNKSENLSILNNQNRRSSNMKNSKKSISLEKFIGQKSNVNNISTKSLFNLTKGKKNEQGENSFYNNNNDSKKKEENSKVKGIRKKLKENKSCDSFLPKKNSVFVEKINLKVIKNNKETIAQKQINKDNNFNVKTKTNFLNSNKLLKRFKKHKSLDFNSKRSLNGLIISKNEIKDLAVRKDNKTPEKDSPILNIHIENNNNKNQYTNKKTTNFTYHIMPGNNSKLIERCILNRDNWIKTSDDRKEFANLIWTPLSSQINFNSHSLVGCVQFVNHFEYHNELTNKSKTFINLLRYCEFNEIDLFSFYPLTIIFTFNSNLLSVQIEKFKKLYNEVPDLLYNENEKNDESDDSSAKYYSDYFNVNLSKKLGSYQKIHIPKTHYNGKNLWLLKRDNLNRGRKIKVFSNLDDILKEINTLNEQKFPKNLLIQKYIEQPLLYNKRKFDIRIWVLFTYLEKGRKYGVYIFKEGHLKACCDEYDINSEDLFIHLTNYSVQKHNKNFSKCEIGNEISFADFQKELNRTGKKINFKKNIFPEIIKIIATSANSVKGKINLSKRTNCFEIFGYDFILDINYRPFLLEINTNPGYEESSPLIKSLVPRMIDDAMRLTIDKEFETTYKSSDQKSSNFLVDGYLSDENMWLKIKTIL